MKNRFFGLLCAVALACAALTSCDPKLDYDHIDPSIKLSTALTLPVGSFSATMGDFLGDETFSNLYADENGVYHLTFSDTIHRQFHLVDINNYTSQANQKFYPTTLGVSVLPAGMPIDLSFPMKVTINNVNSELTFANERIDSIYVADASFTSNFSQNFGLNWSDITKLELILPSEDFSRSEGTTLNIPLSGKNFGENIPIDVNDFIINLMKNRNAAPGATNTKSEVTFIMHFQVTPSSTIALTSESHFDYSFDINFIDYSAIYGWFKLDHEMFVTDGFDLIDMWPIWGSFQSLKLYLYDPQVTLGISTTVAAPLWFHLDFFTSVNREANDSVFAHNFDKANPEGHSFDTYFTNYVTINDPLGTERTLAPQVTFSREFGAMDELFNTHPDYLRMKYFFDSYEGKPGNEQKQYRLDRDTKLHITTDVDVPFSFNKGTDLSFSDTAAVDFSGASLDSLIREVDMLDSVNINDIKLILTAESAIPFDLTGEVFFLDEYKRDLGIRINEENKLVIQGPTEYSAEKVTPGHSQLVIATTDQQLELLEQTRYLVYRVRIADVSNQQNITFPVELGTFTSLKLKLALSADVEAYLQAAFN